MSYVGQTEDISERWKSHKEDAFGNYTCRRYYFQNALAKYGEANFVWQIIDTCETMDESNELEEFYIGYLQTLAPNGYNLLPGGNNRKLSKTTKEKIGETLKITGFFVGKKGSAHPNFGRKLTQEHKNKTARPGDRSSGKKINSSIAIAIYEDALYHDMSISELQLKYILKRGAIYNILHKKCWKDALKHLPLIDFTNGNAKRHSKLTKEDVQTIRRKFEIHTGTKEDFCCKQAKIYKVSKHCIYQTIMRLRNGYIN